MILGFFRQMKEENKAIQEQIPKLVAQQFELQQSKMVTELETRKQAIESSVKGLEGELKEYRELIHQFEKDRDKKKTEKDFSFAFILISLFHYFKKCAWKRKMSNLFLFDSDIIKLF